VIIIVKFINDNNNNEALEIVTNLQSHSGIFLERKKMKKTMEDS
jgi:hypothetical protein